MDQLAAQINRNLEESLRALVNQGVGQGRQGNAPQPIPQPHVSHLHQASSRPQHQASRRSQPNQSPNPQREIGQHSRPRDAREIINDRRLRDGTLDAREIINSRRENSKEDNEPPQRGRTIVYSRHGSTSKGNESLKEYIKRFNTESQRIPDLQDNVAFTALLFGLKSNKMKFELVHDKVSTFSESMERAERIIESSEVCKAPVANNKGKRKQEDNYHENRNRRSRRAESDDEGLKYNVDRYEIYFDIRHKAILLKPNPMNTPIEQRNRKLWSGGFASGGLSKRARKGHLRSLEEPIYDIGTPSSTPKDPLMFEERKCYVDSLNSPESSVNQEDKGAKRKAMDIDEPQLPVMNIYMAENPKKYGRPRPIEEDESIPLGDDPARTIKSVQVCSDSQLNVEKMTKEFEVKEENMKAYFEKAENLTRSFDNFEIKHIPRSRNQQADALARLASSAEGIAPRNIMWEVLEKPSTQRSVVMDIDRGETWMDQITQFLKGELPEDTPEFKMIKKQNQNPEEATPQSRPAQLAASCTPPPRLREQAITSSYWEPHFLKAIMVQGAPIPSDKDLNQAGVGWNIEGLTLLTGGLKITGAPREVDVSSSLDIVTTPSTSNLFKEPLEVGSRERETSQGEGGK
uniref:RNase H type-1 domain-containing protein n=1 Tax=Chenopodium quinoa TaxID=63459 RepID=A0A803NEB6_CHEQI